MEKLKYGKETIILYSRNLTNEQISLREVPSTLNLTDQEKDALLRELAESMRATKGKPKSKLESFRGGCKKTQKTLFAIGCLLPLSIIGLIIIGIIVAAVVGTASMPN